ncbi:MAG TPA: sensor domain-containing protein [Streptosporangiaceae bacterium]
MRTTAGELAGAALRAPFTRRARRELGFCLAGAVPAVAGFFLVVALLFAGTALTATLAGAFPGLLVLVLMLRLARRLGGLHRRLAGRLLGRPFAAPPPFVAARGLLRRLDARLRDGAGWRAVAYTALKLPLALLELYAASFWVSGAINVACPLWWRVFSPSQIVTPLPAGSFGVHNTAGAFAAFLVGSATLLAAPWLTRAVTTADGWLIRGLLGPAQLAQRVAELETSRSLAVDEAAAALRKVERDLHDGAQVRLAALALGLGMAKEKLGDDGKPLDIGQAARVRELVDAAHRSAKDALVELRDLARGIHPPVLDAGLADALATLAAQSIIPVGLTVDLAGRPTPAIETIAYFCAAELLANAAKHSGANRVIMELAQHGESFLMRVTDDGIGGADPTRGSGLPGLVQRVRTVDGRLTLDSPPGGPTVITVELPLRA